MAAITREQVMGNLFTLLQTNVAGVKTFSRRIVMPSEIGSIALPCLSLYRLRETVTPTPTALPNIRHWNVWLILVIQNKDKKVAGDTIINPILDSIDAALAVTDGGGAIFGTQTLGRIVNNVVIQGDVHIEPGDTDPNGIGGAVIPLLVTVP